MSREEFDMDYSGYVIEHFPEFEREHPRLSRRFADTIEHTYASCSWMTDDACRDTIGDAVDAFLGNAPVADIYRSGIAGLPQMVARFLMGLELTLTH